MLDRLRLEQRAAARQQAADQHHHVRHGGDQAATAAEPRDGLEIGAGEGEWSKRVSPGFISAMTSAPA